MSSLEVPIIKVEQGGTAVVNTGAKLESKSSASSTGPHSEEDIYEDAGDLEFADSAQQVCLIRIPKFLWKSWSQMEDDQEIQLGTVRVEDDVENPKRLSILLASDIPFNEGLPKEYNLQITNQEPSNTFIFTERDLPGYSAKSRMSSRVTHDRGSLPFSEVAPRYQSREQAKIGSSKIDKSRKWQSYYRKAIPKKTALAGCVRTEMNCLPVENEEYRRLMDERAMQVLKSKKETQFLAGYTSAPGGNLLAPGTIGTPGSFNTFIKNTSTQRGRAQELKAARIPQNELLDLIGDCFRRYTYWPLKSLKAELNQPEAYLKQTLEMVAHLVKQGPHAMTWQLNRDSKFSAYADAHIQEGAQDKTAPDAGYSFDGISDNADDTGEDEDLIKMEDVLPK